MLYLLVGHEIGTARNALLLGVQLIELGFLVLLDVVVVHEEVRVDYVALEREREKRKMLKFWVGEVGSEIGNNRVVVIVFSFTITFGEFVNLDFYLSLRNFQAVTKQRKSNLTELELRNTELRNFP